MRKGTAEKLVVGLYRYVRNPMYLAVGAVILGQAAVLGRWVLVVYAIAFGATVWSFVHRYEEPALRQRFGAAYEEYLRTVPGWWPRLMHQNRTARK
jgi:protein-S-isoprenylcysteine O-methyltransferase Ste14